VNDAGRDNRSMAFAIESPFGLIEGTALTLSPRLAPSEFEPSKMLSSCTSAILDDRMPDIQTGAGEMDTSARTVVIVEALNVSR